MLCEDKASCTESRKPQRGEDVYRCWEIWRKMQTVCGDVDQQFVNRMIVSEEGEASSLHKITKPTVRRERVQVWEDEEKDV